MAPTNSDAVRGKPSEVRRRPLQRAEVVALADQLRSMLAAISAGELDAPTAMQHRLEGAAVALDAVLGGSSRLPTDLPPEPA